MKNWKIILASILALVVLTVTPLSILAAGQDAATTAVVQAPRVHLAIVQPWVVRVGQKMQLTVFERLNQTPISDAGVWAVSKEKVEPLRQALKPLIAKGLANITEKDYKDILDDHGAWLGRTDTNGRLTHTFDEPANYILVALKPGYLPGYSHLSIREPLAISAPKKAAPDDKVTITVNQKGTTEPVGGAHIWAIDFARAKGLRDRLTEEQKNKKQNLQNLDWESILKDAAFSLGTTNKDGQVTHAFDKGRYLLIATKKGDVPAFAVITVVPPQATTQPHPSQSPSVSGNNTAK